MFVCNATPANLEQNQGVYEKICFCQMFSKNSPHASMKSHSGVTAWIIENGSERHLRGTLKYEKIFQGRSKGV